MSGAIRIAGALVLAVLPVLFNSPVVMADECLTPIDWIPKNYVSSQDMNRNFVDDEIDAILSDELIDVVLCLNACAEQADLNRFAKVGQIGYRSPYISVLVLRNVSISGAIALGQDERVAFVELERMCVPDLDVSMAAAQIHTSAEYAGINVEDQFPGVYGTGVNIAIMDSGVDNISAENPDGHASFPAWKFVGGYDAETDTEGDPEDLNGHGTHVAGIALGTGDPGGVFRGAAPGAGLIDIKAIPGTTEEVMRALDKVIERREDWSIDIINCSWSQEGTQTNGTDAISQTVNRLARAGVLVVTSNGNDGTTFRQTPPATADMAFAVANATDNETVDRGDDYIYGSSTRGPRQNDGDGVTQDEQKPDVAAYGRLITAPENLDPDDFDERNGGSSQASPHVAGLAALIKEVNPYMDNESIKELIRQTAEDRGDPGWDGDWGHGLINGFAAVDQAANGLTTDLYFTDFCNHPWNNIWWISNDIQLVNPQIVEGTQNWVRVKVRNAGPATAYNFGVRLGVNNFCNSTADFEIGYVVVPSLDPGWQIFVQFEWTPEVDGLDPSTVMADLQANIIFPGDTDGSNNCAQRNIQIQQTHSPAVFTMRAVNPTREDADIEITTDPSADELELVGWNINIDRPSFVLVKDDCPVTVVMEMEAVGLSPIDEVPVDVQVMQQTSDGPQSLGGVRLIAQNRNGTPRPPDVKHFDGLRCEALGQARLHTRPDVLIMREMDGDGDDGVEINLGEALHWSGALDFFDPAVLTDGQYVTFSAMGAMDGGSSDQTIAELTFEDEQDYLVLQQHYGPLSSSDLTVLVYNDGAFVHSDFGDDGEPAHIMADLADALITPCIRIGGEFYSRVQFPDAVQMEIHGQNVKLVNGDELLLRWEDVNFTFDYLATARIATDGPSELLLTRQSAGAFDRTITPHGNPRLTFLEGGAKVKTSALHMRKTLGINVQIDNSTFGDVGWQTLTADDLADGAHLALSADGIFTPSGARTLGSLRIQPEESGIAFSCEMNSVGAATFRVEILQDGVPTHSSGGLSGSIGTTDQWPVAGGAFVNSSDGMPGYRLHWSETQLFNLANTAVASGNEIRIVAENLHADFADEALNLSNLAVHAIGLEELTFEEFADAQAPLVVNVELKQHPAGPLPFRMHPNYPDPFSDGTDISFDLLQQARVKLSVYNLRGEQLTQLVDKQLQMGTHNFRWDAVDAVGNRLTAGVYIYRIEVLPQSAPAPFTAEGRMRLIR